MFLITNRHFIDANERPKNYKTKLAHRGYMINKIQQKTTVKTVRCFKIFQLNLTLPIYGQKTLM